jgi:hypothetical protein
MSASALTVAGEFRESGGEGGVGVGGKGVRRENNSVSAVNGLRGGGGNGNLRKNHTYSPVLRWFLEDTGAIV